MIHIDRPNAPDVLVDADSIGVKEREAWEDYYDQGIHQNPPANKPKFNAYRHDSVKDELLDMFNGKCGYCESRINVVTWGDIEHYRPKGQIIQDNGGKKKPGYWWLASDWENLLLACNRCNSTNQQQLFGSSSNVSIGKGNLFPLTINDDRAQWSNDPFDWLGKDVNEKPLLLDPCRDNPEASLECRNDEMAPDRGVLVGRDARGKRTIHILGLNRKPLVDDRKKKLVSLSMLMEDISQLEDDIDEVSEELDDAINANDAARKTRKEQQLQRKMARLTVKRKSLEETADDQEEYLLMTRQLVREFFANHPAPA